MHNFMRNVYGIGTGKILQGHRRTHEQAPAVKNSSDNQSRQFVI